MKVKIESVNFETMDEKYEARSDYLKQNFMDNLKETTALDETAVLAMTARLMTEVYIRSFLIWCFENYGEQMKFKHNDRIYKVINVDELGHVTGIDVEGKEVNLQPKQVIDKLPVKAIRFFQDNWIDIK